MCILDSGHSRVAGSGKREALVERQKGQKTMSKQTKPFTYSQKWRLYEQLCRLAKICEEIGAVEQVIIHGNPDKRSQEGCSDPIVTIEELLKSCVDRPSVKDITKG